MPKVLAPLSVGEGAGGIAINLRALGVFGVLPPTPKGENTAGKETRFSTLSAMFSPLGVGGMDKRRHKTLKLMAMGAGG